MTIVLLTGSPGIGKTAMVKRITGGLVGRGSSRGGYTTSEVGRKGPVNH